MRAVLAVVALALLAIALLLSRGGAPPSPAATVPAAADAAAAPAVSAADRELTTPRVPVAARPIPSAEPAAESPTATIRGRLVDATDSLPVAAGDAWVEPALVRALDALAWPPPTEPTRVRTGADGRFELHVPVDPACRYELFASSDRHAPAGVRLARIVADRELDVGDVRLPPRTGRRGRVVDADSGEPVGGLEIGLGHTLDPIFVGGGGPVGWRPTTTTAADGSFGFDLPLPPRPLPWFVVTPGYERDRPATCTETSTELRVRRLPLSIAGVVVGTDSAPLAGTAVRVSTDTGQAISGVSDEHGRFWLFARADAGPLHAIGVGRHRVLAPSTLAWGDVDLRVIVAAPGTITVRVVDAEGAPVERFRVLLRSPALHTPTAASAGPPEDHGDHHQGGVCRIDGVPVGSNAVLIRRTGERNGRVYPVPSVVEGGSIEVTCRPRPERELRVRAVTPDGQGCAGAWIVLAMPALGDPATGAEQPHTGDHAFVTGSAYRLAAAQAGPDGRALLMVSTEPDGLWLAVRAEQTTPQLFQALELLPRDADGTVLVVVPTAPQLRITVRGAGALQTQLGGDLVLLVGLADGPAGAVRYSEPLRGDAADFPLLPERALPIRIGWQDPRRGLTWWPDDLGLVMPGQTGAAVDAPAVHLAGLNGRARCAAPGWRVVRVDIAGRGAPWSGHQQTARVDDDGRFRIDGLLPGDVDFFVTLESGQQRTLRLPAVGGPDRIDAGDQQVELRVPDIELRLTVRDADGRALALTPVLLNALGVGFQAASTDAAGLVTFRPAPAGTVTIQAGTQFGLDLPAVDGIVERELRLPGR